MSESFIRRWARRKTENSVDSPSTMTKVAVVEQHATAGFAAPESLTMRDVAALTVDADYSRFVGAGLEKTVHRAAMKKLFSDPHFNVMDGLDIYISDYNLPSPVSAAMLAALAHAITTLDPQPLGAGRTAPHAVVDAGDDDIPDSAAVEAAIATPFHDRDRMDTLDAANCVDADAAAVCPASAANATGDSAAPGIDHQTPACPT